MFHNSQYLKDREKFFALLENISIEEKKADLDSYFIRLGNNIDEQLEAETNLYLISGKFKRLVPTDYEFLNNSTEKNLKKVYKSLYNYCINEYLRYYVGEGKIRGILRKYFYDNFAYSLWLKRHPQ